MPGAAKDEPVYALLGVPNVVAAAVVAALVALLFHRRVFGANERTTTSWADAWLKAFVILVFATFCGVYLPSWALQTKTVAEFDRAAQDVVGAGVWVVAMVLLFWGLWYAHRQKRV